MDPFFGGRGWYQQPDPVSYGFNQSPFRGVPIHRVDPWETQLHSSPAQRPAERYPAQKVVRIPVQFVGSKKADRPGSALKIQKVFRGFLVRKCLKKIKDIKAQVDAIEERLADGGVVDLVRKDEKERLRMNETLMSLLIRLDSISGLDFGVRTCRKAVIRKAIALQEKIDAIVARDSKGDGENSEAGDQEKEIQASADVESSNQAIDSTGNGADCAIVAGDSKGDGENSEAGDQEKGIPASAGVESSNQAIDWTGNCADCDIVIQEPENNPSVDVASTNQPIDQEKPNDSHGNDGKSESSIDPEILNNASGGDKSMEVEGNQPEPDVIDVGVDCEVKVGECESSPRVDADNQQPYPIARTAEAVEEANAGDEGDRDNSGDNKRNRELLERMMEENEKMMSMMRQLFERNEAQTHALNALTQRVEALEKALACDRQRKKKKGPPRRED